jgi:hypothetical protein
MALFHSLNQISLIPFTLMINVDAISMIGIVEPVAHVDIALLSLKDADTVP